MLQTAYKYSDTTTEYLGEIKVQNNPKHSEQWLIPDYVTLVTPPSASVHQVACWCGSAWQIKADYRGMTYYKKFDQSKLVITEIGIAPTNEYTELVPQSAEQVWDGTKWDYPLAWYKSNKNKELTTARDNEEYLNVTTGNGTFEFDALSQTRLTNAMNSMENDETREWTTADGQIVEMTKADFKAIFTLAAERSDENFSRLKALKIEVANATTIEEVKAITWR